MDPREREFIIKVVLEMKRKKITINRLAREAEVSRISVYNWLNGYQGMNLRHYYRVRDFLNIKD